MVTYPEIYPLPAENRRGQSRHLQTIWCSSLRMPFTQEMLTRERGGSSGFRTGFLAAGAPSTAEYRF